jgi:hypothetical protein
VAAARRTGVNRNTAEPRLISFFEEGPQLRRPVSEQVTSPAQRANPTRQQTRTSKIEILSVQQWRASIEGVELPSISVVPPPPEVAMPESVRRPQIFFDS